MFYQKSIFIFIILVFFIPRSFSAHLVENQFQVTYQNPNGIRINETFSGNYGVSSFSFIQSGLLALLCTVDQTIKIYDIQQKQCIKEISLMDVPEDFIFYKNKFFVLSNYQMHVYNMRGEYIYEFPIHSEFKFIERLYGFQHDLYLLYANGQSFKIMEKGKPLSPDEQKQAVQQGLKIDSYTSLRVKKNNESEFTLSIFRDGVATREVPFWVDHKLGSVSIIGLVDDVIYFDVQYILRDVPLVCERHIVAYTLHGDQIIDNVTLPNCYYLCMKHDILTSNEGLHHLVASPKFLYLFHLSFNRQLTKTIYPTDCQKSYHYNWSLPNMESSVHFQRQRKTVTPSLSITRSRILENADAYEKLQWRCFSENTTRHELVVLPDGAYVRTPVWVKTGNRTKMPYKWGGFTHVDNFKNRIETGCLAGDDYCVRGVSYAASYGDAYCIGVDCSGLVSRAWGLPQKEWTGSLPNISTELADWSDAVRGDIANAAGSHVMLIVSDYPSGSMGIIHASGYDWRVSYMLAYPNNMIGYVPRKYNYVIDDLEEVDPETIPSTFALHQNYPNPFNASTTISYDVPQYSFVTLDLYNIRGEPLQNLYHGFQNAQHHTFQWETSHIPSGVYFYRIQIGKWRSVKKCVLIK